MITLHEYRCTLQQWQEQCYQFVPWCVVFLHVKAVLWLPVFGIFNVHTDVDTCDGAWWVYKYCKIICSEGWLGENPLLRWKIDQASSVFSFSIRCAANWGIVDLVNVKDIVHIRAKVFITNFEKFFAYVRDQNKTSKLRNFFYVILPFGTSVKLTIIASSLLWLDLCFSRGCFILSFLWLNLCFSRGLFILSFLWLNLCFSGGCFISSWLLCCRGS